LFFFSVDLDYSSYLSLFFDSVVFKIFLELDNSIQRSYLEIFRKIRNAFPQLTGTPTLVEKGFVSTPSKIKI
jgi:hypothetical protein